MSGVGGNADIDQAAARLSAARASQGRRSPLGCTTKQIMAILGHKSIAEAARNTREAD